MLFARFVRVLFPYPVWSYAVFIVLFIGVVETWHLHLADLWYWLALLGLSAVFVLIADWMISRRKR